MRDRRQERASRTQAAARHPALEPVTTDADAATTRSARTWSTRRAAGWSPASPASSARRCSSGCSISARPSSASTTSSPATSSNLDDVLAINPDERLQFQFIEGDLRDPEVAQDGVQGRRHRPAPGRARLGAALDEGSDRVAPAQRRRVPQRAVGARRTPASSASSTRRARRSTAITRACRSTRTGSASRCRRTRRPSAPTRSTRRCSTTLRPAA